MYSYSDVKQVINQAASSDDINIFVNVIDELFLKGEVVLTDDEWNRYSLDIDSRLDFF